MPTDPAQALALSDAVVVVTGGTRGVGRGVAQRFVDAGARVYVLGRNPPEDPGSPGTFVACNVRDTEQVDEAFGRIDEEAGGVDVLVNNAGGAPPADAATASPRFHAAIIDLNLTAALHCSQRARKSMIAMSGVGRIINIASTAGVRSAPKVAAYGAAKAGLLSLTRSLAEEWAPQVRVNAVVPGAVRTEQTAAHFPDEAAAQLAQASIPLGRFATPKDVGDACLFLASPVLAGYVTGASLLLHGGGE